MTRQQRLIAATGIIFSVMASQASGGSFFDDNDLYAKCTSSVAGDRALCTGYVMSILDAGQTEAGFPGFNRG